MEGRKRHVNATRGNMGDSKADKGANSMATSLIGMYHHFNWGQTWFTLRKCKAVSQQLRLLYYKWLFFWF